MKLQRLAAAWAVVALLTAGGRASAEIEFNLNAWLTDISGTAREGSAAANDVVNLEDDLGLPNVNFPEFQMDWRWGKRSALRVAYTQLNYRGDSILARTFTYDGTAYNIGDRVFSGMDLNLLRLGYFWTPFQWKYAQLGFSANLHTLWGKVRLDVPTRGVSESAKLTAPIPTVGAALTVWPVKWLNVYGEAAGITLGDTGHLYDLNFGATVRPTADLYVRAGFRQIEVEYNDEPDFVDMRINGPYFTAGWTY